MTGPVVIPAELAETLDDLLAELDRRERSSFPLGTELTLRTRDALAAARREAADGATLPAAPRPDWSTLSGMLRRAQAFRAAMPAHLRSAGDQADAAWRDGVRRDFGLDLRDETNLFAVIAGQATMAQNVPIFAKRFGHTAAHALATSVVGTIGHLIPLVPDDVLAELDEAESRGGE